MSLKSQKNSSVFQEEREVYLPLFHSVDFKKNNERASLKNTQKLFLNYSLEVI